MLKSKRVLTIVLTMLAVCCVMVVGCGSKSTQENRAASSLTVNDQQQYKQPNKAEQQLNWIDSLGNPAYNVMMGNQYDEGTTAWIYGYVYNVHYAPDSNGQPTFIDMSEKGYESRQLTAIVWGENLGNFNMDLNSLQGKYIAVYGTVYRYQGLFKQMELTDQSQISICPVAA